MSMFVFSSEMPAPSGNSNVMTGIWDLFSASKRNVTSEIYEDGSRDRLPDLNYWKLHKVSRIFQLAWTGITTDFKWTKPIYASWELATIN